MSSDAISADYIVIGSGSAGAIVAARLSENPQVRVLLLEAGPEDNSPWSKIPLGFGKILFDPRYMWYHTCEPEPALRGRRVNVAHGKVVGGSSSINGLIYVRGFPLDYALWRQSGAVGWAYDDVLPYFKKSERRSGSSDYHGTDGPLGVETARWPNPLADAFIASARAIGVPRNHDFAAGPNVEGAGYYDLTTWQGRRSSTAETYIKPNRKRPNLRVVTEAFVTRIEFAGRRAVSVVYERGGETIRARAAAEIILSAGALHTPQLLQLSGIGPPDVLRQLGIPVVHELGGVGENLMDHIHVGRTYTTTSPYTFNTALRNPFAKAATLLKYFVGGHTGPMAIGPGVAGAFCSTRPGLEAPDVQIGISPFLPDEKEVWKLARESGFRMSAYQFRPESRGFVRITSPDPRVKAAIRFNYFASQTDMKTIIAGMKLTQRIGAAEPLEQLGVQEVKPGPDGDSDELLIDHIIRTADTGFHYSGTARMGVDVMAVVDPSLRVRGVERLRVIDASIMPTIVSGNTNAAAVMIGEKGADLVKAGP